MRSEPTSPNLRVGPSLCRIREEAGPRGLRPRRQWCESPRSHPKVKPPTCPGWGSGRLFRSNLKHHNGMTVIKHPLNGLRSPSGCEANTS